MPLNGPRSCESHTNHSQCSYRDVRLGMFAKENRGQGSPTKVGEEILPPCYVAKFPPSLSSGLYTQWALSAFDVMDFVSTVPISPLFFLPWMILWITYTYPPFLTCSPYSSYRAPVIIVVPNNLGEHSSTCAPENCPMKCSFDLTEKQWATQTVNVQLNVLDLLAYL